MILPINYSQVTSELLFPHSKKQLRKTSLKKLLKLSTEGMLIHNGKVFSQIECVAMVNLLGPWLINWFLGMIEKEKLLIEIFSRIHHSMCVKWTMFLLFSIH